MNEADFIAALRTLPLHKGARNLEDDCAVIALGSETLILNHDMMAAGTHWLPEQDPADIAWKLVAVNLSDLAAKGAKPLGILLGHSLGDKDERFIEGLREVCETYNVPILGGDTVCVDGPRTLGITAIGRATHTPVPSRSGAQVGDRIWMTGHVGKAYDAFLNMPDGTPTVTVHYRRPSPRLEEGQKLAPLVTAMMDSSDGLLLDCWRMASASGVTFSLSHHNFAYWTNGIMGEWQKVIRWGEDYELLFTLPGDIKLPVPGFYVGKVVERGATPLILDGEPIADADGLGYSHG